MEIEESTKNKDNEIAVCNWNSYIFHLILNLDSKKGVFHCTEKNTFFTDGFFVASSPILG